MSRRARVLADALEGLARGLARDLARSEPRRGPLDPVRVIDVGAGDGDVGRRIARALGADLVAFDVSPVPTRPRRPAEPGLQVCAPRRPGALGTAGSLVPTRAFVFDGRALPAADRSFDLALLSDVLHHAEAPELLLRECLRVADAVLVKDHFSEGLLDDALLTAMDLWGNAARGVASPGRYLSPLGWRALFERVGAEPVAWVWPLDVHPAPIRLFTRSERQFAVRLERAS